MPTGNPSPSFTFVDLFAGIGGFHVGLSAIGGHCVFASEWDRHAAKTYAAWTGFSNVNTEDIREVEIEGIPRHDVLCAGFPCQPFSLAGVSKKNALGRPHGFDDLDQGNLFFRIRDIAQSKRRPPVLFLENVKNLLRHDGGNTWTVITDCLEDLDYEVRHAVIDAASWVPQHRERVYIVAFDRKRFRKSETDAFRFPDPPRRRLRLGSVLEDDPDRKYMLSDALWTYLKAYAEKHRQKGNGFGFGMADRDGVSRTLSARYYKDGSEILVREQGWRNPRRLTPREATRLMGFLPRYAGQAGLKEFPQVVSDGQMYKQLGNAVCPPVIEAIGREIVNVLGARRERLDRARKRRGRST